MKRPSTEQAAAARQAHGALRQGLALALHDIGNGRAELRASAAQFQALRDRRGARLASSALLLFIGIADDDYAGFEAAVAVVADDADGMDTSPWHDPGDALLAEAGALTAGAFSALDAPGLAARAARIAQALSNREIAAPLRCCAGLAALGYHHIGMDLASVLWLELAMRPLLADPAVGARLADEAFHLFVQSLYQCEAAAQAVALRERRRAAGPAPLPVIELKLQLLDAQMALGAGQADAGRQALARAEPLLDPRAPRPAGWWHLLRSRLDLLEGQHRPALVHARLALRLASQSQLPERWMGVTVMQEGQVLMARGEYLRAVPFFERAGAAASGSQAGFCHCLAQLARALDGFENGNATAGRLHLAAGLQQARELAWTNFFRAVPQAAAALCGLALEHQIEATFAREVIAARDLQAVRPDLSAWPWPIRVRCFGALRVEIDGRALVFKGKVAKKPLDLLLFIVASGGSEVSAASAMFALWRELEGDKAQAAFTVALHRLRRLLGPLPSQPGQAEAVRLEHGRLSLSPQRVWVDCLAFEQLVDSVGLPAPDALGGAARAAAERALLLYGGAFLHDTEDEAWQLVCRTRLASKFRRMVSLLARAALARGDVLQARALIDRGLEFDPLAEELLRLLPPPLRD